MTSLVLLMGAVCLAPVLVSLLTVALASGTRSHRVLVGSLAALFGFLLGLVAVFCGVLLPVSSLGLSGVPVRGASSLTHAVALDAGIATLVAAALSFFVTKGLARAITNREGRQ